MAASVAHGEEFYKGKTIRLVVGAPPGGGYDAYTRLTARHIGKYVIINPVTGEGVEQHVEKIFSMSPEAKKSLGFLVRKKKQ